MRLGHQQAAVGTVASGSKVRGRVQCRSLDHAGSIMLAQVALEWNRKFFILQIPFLEMHIVGLERKGGP